MVTCNTIAQTQTIKNPPLSFQEWETR